MGGALYCSVALSLKVTRPLGLFEDGYFSDGDIKNIIESLGKLVDLKLYNIKKNSKEVVLSLKKDVFNKNIQDLYLEISSKIDLTPNSFYLLDVLDYNYPKEKWKIYLDKNKENVVNMEEPKETRVMDCTREEEHNFSFLLKHHCKHYNEYRLGIKPFKVFMDFHPIEDNIICILNWFKKDYFKNPLNGALIFHNYRI